MDFSSLKNSIIFNDEKFRNYATVCAEALQNSLLLLGNDLVGTQIGRSQNLATLGANAAAGQATTTNQSGRNIADLFTQQGNAQAAGLVGAANSRASGASNVLGAALGIGKLYALSDIRAKTDIEPFGKSTEGINIYKYRYKGDPEPRVGVMAQEVEATHPEAVVTISGLRHVDYGALH